MNNKYKDGDELALILPGQILFEEFMKPYDLSVNELARQLKVAPTAISEIVRGKRAISTAMAARLGRFFQNSMEMWLNLQQSYEIEEFNRTAEPVSIALHVVPFNYDQSRTLESKSCVSEDLTKVAYKKKMDGKEKASVSSASKSGRTTKTKVAVASKKIKTNSKKR